MVTRKQAQEAIDRLRPFLQAQGADIQLVDSDTGTPTVRLSGSCVGCSSAPLSLHDGLDAALRFSVRGLRTIRPS